MNFIASALPVKPICRFLLNRYLGEILLEKVSLEQLSVDVLNGTGSISDVNLDVQHINRSLDKNSVPFELVDGFMGDITVHIPYSKVLEDSCTIEVTGLELTIQPKPCSSTDLVSSMIESVIGSMTTSIDLARSFVEEQGNAEVEQQFQGIDALAQIIQIILSRMKINFNNTVVRLEHFPSSTHDTGIALEIIIDRIEFVDEVVDVLPKSDDEPITEQPQSSATTFATSPIQDLSKIVKLQGVRLFTDIFTKPEGALCKSVVFRRKPSEIPSNLDIASEASCSTDTSVYKSCYNGVSSANVRSTVLNGEFTSSTSSCLNFPANLCSKPVQFAEFSSDRLTVRIRLKNSSVSIDGFKHEEVDIELFLGALNVFLTPTQLYLLTEIANSLITDGELSNNSLDKTGGKPMQNEDFAKVEMDLRRKIEENRLPTSCFKPNDLCGNWSGEDKFYHSSKTPWKKKVENDSCEFTTIPMSSIDDNGPDLLQPAQPHHRRHTGENLHKLEGARSRKSSVPPYEKPENNRCKIRLSSFIFVLTHDDPLSTLLSAQLDITTSQLISVAENFFETARQLPLSAGSRLRDFRQLCDKAYSKDHIRLVACPLVLEYIQNKDIMQISLTSSKLELLECLFDGATTSSANDRTGREGHSTYVQVLSFNEADEMVDQPDVYLRFATEDRQNYACTVELNKCSMEIDISIVDRLHNLLFCQPCFKFAKPVYTKYLFEVPNKTNLDLREDWFEPLNENPVLSQTCSLDVMCSNLTIDLRIPVPDLRPAQAVDRSPWWIRRVRDDFVRFCLEETKLKSVLCENIGKLGHVVAEFSKGTIYLVEADKQEPTKFVHFFEENRQSCGFEFKWDFVNRSLFEDRLQDSNNCRSNESLLNSLERSCFKISTNLDGPFSKKHVVHEDEQLTIVGSKSEMKEFRKKCLKYCEMGINFRIPGCRLFLPDKQFYELLYNRLVNDLSFWVPSCPGFQSCTQNGLGNNSAFNVLVTGLGLEPEHFGPCKSGLRSEDSDSDSESTLKSSTFGAFGGNKRKGPHKFSCLLQCGYLDVLMCLTDKDSVASAAKLRLQLHNGELFFVYGYENDENTSYFYTTSEKAFLKHAPEDVNLVVLDDIVTDVSLKEFAKNQDWLNTMEPTPSNLTLKTEQDDNFSLAMRFVLHPKENVKDFLITFGIRNSTLNYQPLPTGQLWLTQLVEFFDVVDYPVIGFDPPKVINEIHAHAWNLVLQYKPEKLPYALRCYVDSLDVSTNLVQESSMFRFHIILEDTALFLTDKAKSTTDLLLLTMRDYVCLMKMGFFELTLTTFEPPSDDKDRSRPLQQIHVHNDALEIRTCADSCAILASIIKYIAVGADSAKTSTENTDFVNDVDENICPSNSSTTNNVHHDTDYNEKLKDLMSSAMEETVLPQPPKAPPRSKNNERSSGGVKTKPLASVVSTASRRRSSHNDDEFLILDEVPGTGIRSKSGEPRIRTLVSDPIVVVDNHVTPPLQRTDPLTTLPSGYPLPLLQYFLRDFTIVWHMYGGRDFGEAGENKAYSRMSDIQHTSTLRQKFNEAKRNIFTSGGANRDHTVHAELYLNKMCLLYELYPPGHPQAARQILTIQDVEIRDHLYSSKINKLLYRYTTEQKPKQTYLPMFSVKLLHFIPDSGEIQGDGECCLKVSLLPLRLNIDQDTLLFLSEFGRDFSQVTSNVAGGGSVKRPGSVSSLPGVKLGQIAEENKPNDALSSDRVNAAPKSVPVLSEKPAFQPPPPLNDSLFDGLNEMALKNCENHATPSFDIDIDETCSLDSDVKIENGLETNFNRTSRDSSGRSRTLSSCSVKSDSEFKRTNSQTSLNDCGYYFKSFVFSPAAEIMLDYHGKRFQLEQGALHGLLLGLSQLTATELKLKELHYRYGLLGFEKVMNYAINEWLTDIRKNQMYNLVGGVGPVHTLLQVSQGIVDLFWLPVDQYRRDGHVVKGFQRGAQSFGVSTASAALELSQRLVGAVQGVAEFAFDIVNPEYPPTPSNDILRGLVQPYDFREGVHMACATVRRGFTETAEAITLATQEEKARGRWAVRGVLRQATPTVIRPLVVFTQATTHVLGGLRNQLRPDSWREEQDKWKTE